MKLLRQFLVGISALGLLLVLSARSSSVRATSTYPLLPGVSVSPRQGDCLEVTVEVDGGLGSAQATTEPECGSTGFYSGTRVSLVAEPGPGYTVYGWRGTDDDSSTAITNTKAMTGNATIGVHFVALIDATTPVSRGTLGGVATVKEPLPGGASAMMVDDRTRIRNTTDLPWRRIVYLDLYAIDGAVARGTGFFVGPNVIATAGHCLYDSSHGGWMSAVRVVPGKDSLSEPYGSRTSSNLWSVSGWVDSALPAYDYGAVILSDNTLGNQVGWFDYGYFSDAYILASLDKLAGYPLDKSDPNCVGCQLWYDSGSTAALDDRIVYYPIYAYNGQSGGPVWRTDGSQNLAIAINAYAHCGGDVNCGTRITPDVADFYESLGAASPWSDCLYNLGATVSPAGSGTVLVGTTKTPGCPLGLYASGETVGLMASPATGYEFVSWSGTNNNSANPTTVTMNANKSVTANFHLIDTTAPTIIFSYSASTNTWYNSDQSIGWSISDSDSGVWGYSRQWGGDPGGSSPTYIGSASGSIYLSSAGEGKHRLYVRAWDNRSNSSVSSAGEFWYDVSAPSVPSTIASTSHSLSTWSSDNTVDVNWSGASDTLSGVGGYSVEWSQSPTTLPDATADTSGTTNTSPSLNDGNCWYVHVRPRDAVGNWNASAAHYGPFYIDSTPPSGSISIAADATHVNSTTVQLTLSANDTGSGPSHMQFSNDGVAWSSWEPYATGKEWTLTAGDGPKMAYVRYRDAVGNVSEAFTDTVVLDTVVLNASIVIAGGATYVNHTTVDLTLYAGDAGNGVSQMQFSDDGSTWGEWEPYAISKAWTLPDGDGPKAVYVRYQDGIGSLSAVYSDTVALDTTNPSGGLVIAEGATYVGSVNVNLSLSASDSGSGVSEMRFSNDGSTWVAWEGFASSRLWMLTAGDGAKHVYAQYRDAAHNLSPVYSGTVTLDTTAPSGSIAIAGDAAWVTSTGVTLSLSASDGGSGLWQMRLSDVGSPWGAWEPYVATRSWTLPSGDGQKAVSVQYRDALSNTSAIYSDTISLDQMPPTGNVSIAAGAPYVNSLEVDLTLLATDVGSGVSAMQCSSDGSTWTQWEPYVATKSWKLSEGYGVKWVYVRFRDEGGHISATCSDTIILVPPTWLPSVLRG